VRENCLQRLFRWLEDRHAEILADAQLLRMLAALSLFPGSSGALFPMSKLALPGNFSDPLGLATLVDVAALGGRREFLRDLGMRELDFGAYVSSLLPEALAAADVPAKKRRDAILLLAGRVGALKDEDEARDALADAEIIECADRKFRGARACHFDSEAVRVCLGDDAHIAIVPKGHEAAVRDLYEWLGVKDEPGLTSIVQRVQDLSTKTYCKIAAQQIRQIVAHLGKRVSDTGHYSQLLPLKRLKWLPARDRQDRWYAPAELYATYQSYLFGTQALFVDASAPVQTASQSLFQLLGIRLTPSTELVVKHLLCCAEHDHPVNAQVYRFLNERLRVTRSFN
jgi:hypothetical protein